MPSYHDSDGSNPMPQVKIDETIDGFVHSARRCKDEGIDGVEVWAAYYGIVDHLWPPQFNRREDRQGGSLENRTRISREIFNRMRKLCGEDFIIGTTASDESDFEVAL